MAARARSVPPARVAESDPRAAAVGAGVGRGTGWSDGWDVVGCAVG